MELAQKTILIVEDEVAISKGIAIKFSLNGFNVFRAADGAEGYSIAIAKHPDMILLDYRMPNVDGLTMLAKLREDAWGKGAHVIMWSNSHGVGTIAKAQELGVLDFIIKSDWEYRDVVKKVKDALGM